jgi:hypothetical protein
MAVSDLHTLDQMVQVKDVVELREAGLASRAGDVTEWDLRGKTTMPVCAMDRSSGPHLQHAISWMSAGECGCGKCITYRHQGLVKRGDDFGANVPDNAGGIGNPNGMEMAASQEERPQVGEAAATLEHADDNLRRGGRNEDAGSRHCGGGMGVRSFQRAERGAGWRGALTE